MRLWMVSATTMSAAAAMGLALGSYVTSPQRSPLERPDMVEALAPTDDAALASADPGPMEIHCTGCGPTLADRHYAAQMAGMDSEGMMSGSNDPVVQDYLAQAQAMPPVDDAPPPRIDPPKIQSVRYADNGPAAPHIAPTPTPVAIPVAVAPTQEGAGPTDVEPLPPIVPTSPR